MNIKGKHYRTVWVSGDGKAVEIIDQTKLPFKFEVVELTSAEMAATAIQEMWVRGAPLIGVVAAYGIALGMNHDASDMGLQRYYDLLIKTRPTAINLKWALDRMIDTLKDLCVSERKDVAWALAAHDNHVPFYVALPSPTIDWTIEDGKSIPIEQRDGKEQSHVYGINPQGELSWVNTAPEGTRCGNYAFDVTPARYITGFITERGVCAASKSALADMFADLKSKALQGEQH